MWPDEFTCVRSLAVLGEPFSLPFRFWCCLEPLQPCLQENQHHRLPLPLLLCSYVTKKIRWFKRFFITWECFQRTQIISSCIGHFPCWQSNNINVTFLFIPVWVPKFFRVDSPWWPRGQIIFPMLLRLYVPPYCSDNSSKDSTAFFANLSCFIPATLALFCKTDLGQIFTSHFTITGFS